MPSRCSYVFPRIVAVFLLSLAFPAALWAQPRLPCTLRESATPVALYKLLCLEIELVQVGEQVGIIEHARQEVDIEEPLYLSLLTAPDETRRLSCPAGAWNFFALLGGIPNLAADECDFSDNPADHFVYIRKDDPEHGPQVHAVDKRLHAPQKQGRQVRSFVPPVPGLDIANGEMQR